MPHPSEQQLSLFPVQDYDLEMPWSFLDGAETWNLPLSLDGVKAVTRTTVKRPRSGSMAEAWLSHYQTKEIDNGNR